MKKKIDNVIHIRAVVPLGEEENKPQISKVRKYRKIWIPSVCLIVVLVIAWGMGTRLTTYTSVEVLQTYDDVIVANNNCVSFADGILRYGKDGVAYIDSEGQEVWNHPYQISNPAIEITGQSAVIADIDGNYIVVVNEQGVKGEMETFLPIEKVTVSSQGIVAVLVKDSYTPQIICYDAVGNILVEHKTSLQGTGYPIGLSLSLDGTMLLVSYLQVTVDGIATSYAYYNFSGDDFVTGNIVESGTRSDVVIPEVKFINEDTSVMISEDSLEIFIGESMPKLTYTISINKAISNVFYGDDLIGLLLEGTGDEDYELQVYSDEGGLLLSQGIVGDYDNVDIIDNQIILYGGEECLIYSVQGIEKFNGEMNMEISGVFPVFGINKYVIIGDEGMVKVQLAR